MSESVQVTSYYARWKPEDHTGYVRNESPIWWDNSSGRLYCFKEPVGEGE